MFELQLLGSPSWAGVLLGAVTVLNRRHRNGGLRMALERSAFVEAVCTEALQV